MTTQEADRIYDEMKSISTKLDVLMPLPTEVRAIKDHLARLNGSTARNTENISGQASELAGMKADVMWLKKIVWGAVSSALLAMATGVYNLIIK